MPGVCSTSVSAGSSVDSVGVALRSEHHDLVARVLQHQGPVSLGRVKVRRLATGRVGELELDSRGGFRRLCRRVVDIEIFRRELIITQHSSVCSFKRQGRVG